MYPLFYVIGKSVMIYFIVVLVYIIKWQKLAKMTLTAEK